jgi:1-acyl-sn-glycerol-3-phosphate acyltransferase
MRFLLKLLHGFYIVYAYLLFIVGLLVIFPGVFIALLLGQPNGGNLVIHLCRGWSDCWLFLIGIRNKSIIKEPVDPKKHYVFVSNHISYLDIPVIFQGIRKNNFRVLGKTEMSKIPVFGVVYKLAVVLVDRATSEGRAKSLKTLRKVLNQNISILIYPEGTFNETDAPLKSFYDGAFRIAIETQTPIKPIVYPDTFHLMHHNSPFSLRPGVSRVVILPEIPVDGFTMNDLPALKKNVYEQMEKCIIEQRAV